jgi:hypothetical protein
MNAKDEQELRELQADLLAAERSPWQPRCVSRAFRSEPAAFVFTLQTWIDLDALRSPFLLSQLPDPEDDVIARFREALAAFGHTITSPEKCEGDELALLGHKMLRTIREAFAMRVNLMPPNGASVQDNPGTGEWLTILRFLKAQMGFGLPEALALPVAQAFALIVSQRTFEGWTVADETYATREVPDHG